ncbi:MAG: CBS domain-containing protein [Planctomycetota bacterium]
MRAPVIRVKQDQTVRQAMAWMRAKRIRHLPVVHKDRLTGIISSRDRQCLTVALYNSSREPGRSERSRRPRPRFGK